MSVKARFGEELALVFGRPARDQFDRPAVRWRFTDVIQAVFQPGELGSLTHVHILQRRRSSEAVIASPQSWARRISILA
jgi:hypothetical protein